MPPFLRKQKGPTMGHPTLVSIIFHFDSDQDSFQSLSSIAIDYHPFSSNIIHHPLLWTKLLSNHLAKKYNINLSRPPKKQSVNIPGQPSYHSRLVVRGDLHGLIGHLLNLLLQSRYTTHCNATCNIIHSHIVIMCIPSISHMYVYIYIANTCM